MKTRESEGSVPARGEQMGERYLTAKQVSERLDGLITVKTLANWRSDRNRRGGPPFLKLGNRIAYPESKLELWLETRQFDSTPKPDREASARTRKAETGPQIGSDAWWDERQAADEAPETLRPEPNGRGGRWRC